MKYLRGVGITVFLLLLTQFSLAVTTVLHRDQQILVDKVLADPNDLWVTPQDLPRVNGFELKPEGACLDDLCVPVMQDSDSELFVTRKNQAWFNVSGLARKLKQAYTFDYDSDVWSFSDVPITRQQLVKNRMAPDFELLDISGKPIKLSAYKDKKVILLTWASW